MFEKLFSPIELGPVRIKNRIQLPPHSNHFFRDGLPTDTLLEYYRERARGGAGLLEVSQIYIKAPTGILYPEWEYDNKKTWPMVNKPEIVPGLKKLANVVHEYDAKIFMEVAAWTFLFGPVSSVPFETGLNLNELTIADIHEIQEGFAVAARYVREGEFDGVDLHGSHGAMIEHFYSPLMNRRNDQYGGSFENRLRFLFELIEILKGTIGDSLALGMRLCADEKIEGGVTPDYAAKIAMALDGRLDFINVDRGSMYNYEVLDQNALQTEPLYEPPGYGTYLSEPIKAAVKKTKIGLAGRITDALIAETILEKGQADFVGMTRALIADPYLPKKVLEGKIEDVRACIGTLEGCWGRSAAHDFPMRCSVNAAVGRELERNETKLGRAQVKKKVLVIGAGPAGLEAARVAAMRGHDVVVYEKETKAGGQVNIGKLVPGRSDISSIVTWLEAQLKTLRVRIEFNKEVPESEEVLRFLIEEEEKPDAVIIATGSTPIRTGIQMLSFQEVPGWKEANSRSIDEVLTRQVQMAGRKFLVADSTPYLQGPGACQMLARNGASEITFVTPQTEIAPEMNDYNSLIFTVRSLKQNQVRCMTYSWVRRIEVDTEKRVVVYDIPTGEETSIEVDEVVFFTGRKQNNSLVSIARELHKEVYEIGDCRIAGGKIVSAIEDGFVTGSKI
ncbi:MAG: FAD-dependent oxidoreductase [Thaumarchaeota archaeon]|nr:FAD-dependent oxidoreductase [Nitrososphaerota archaeon]